MPILTSLMPRSFQIEIHRLAQAETARAIDQATILCSGPDPGFMVLIP